LCEKVYGVGGRGKSKGLTVLAALKAKDSRDYQLQFDEFFNPVGLVSRADQQEMKLAKFTLWRNLPLFENPTGTSDFRAAYRAAWLLDTTWRFRSIGLERFALPLMIGKYPNNQNDVRAAVEAAIKKAKALGYVVVPEEAAIQG